jgi:hypothetical protein
VNQVDDVEEFVEAGWVVEVVVVELERDVRVQGGAEGNGDGGIGAVDQMAHMQSMGPGQRHKAKVNHILLHSNDALQRGCAVQRPPPLRVEHRCH